MTKRIETYQIISQGGTITLTIETASSADREELWQRVVTLFSVGQSIGLPAPPPVDIPSSGVTH